MAGTLLQDLSAFVTAFLWILLGMWNNSDKSCRENENTHFFQL